MQEFNGLVEILESFLGEPKNGVSDNGQLQFNCPACAEDSGQYNGDGKYNLEINLFRGKFRCWACEHTNNMSGNLSKLIKDYGGDVLLNQYRNEIVAIKKSKEYELHYLENDLRFDDDEELIIKLPEKSYDFIFDGNKREQRAIQYLHGRGITDSQILKYGLKYTDNYCPVKNFKNRIIIPSYDKYNQLNYYTGRDYTDWSFKKYQNIENLKNLNRKGIIFNEHLLNWDADITLVEGPTDHIAIPNSTTLLGKAINSDYYLFDCITKKSTQKIYIFLDDDAYDDAITICDKLSCYELCGRLWIIPTKKLKKLLINDGCDIKKLDPSSLYKLKGPQGISWAHKLAEEYQCK